MHAKLNSQYQLINIYYQPELYVYALYVTSSDVLYIPKK